jgi:hypothetical protein
LSYGATNEMFWSVVRCWLLIIQIRTYKRCEKQLLNYFLYVWRSEPFVVLK